MNYPFIIGQTYFRSKLLEFVGSKQRQSGIIWGQTHSDVIICTSGGRHGSKAGYEDQLNNDGTCQYIGQGATGDQKPDVFANRKLIEGKCSILLFITKEPRQGLERSLRSWKKKYKFIGEFCVGSWNYFVPTEGPRKGNQLIKFILVPTHNILLTSNESEIEYKRFSSENLDKLRSRVIEMGVNPKQGTVNLQEYYERSELLKEYAKQRAAGICEFCNQNAPFQTIKNEPYLEVHHIFRLADEGPNCPKNVAALCPNCHRKAHYGSCRLKMQTTLFDLIKQKEL